MLKKGFLFCTALSAMMLSACANDDKPTQDCADDTGAIHKIGVGEICCNGQGVAESDANCGACGVACVNGNHCVDHRCTCEGTPGKECSNTCTATGCVDTKIDPKNCGTVGKACENGEVCNNGTCSTSCGDTLENCSGICTDINSNASNCGECGRACQGADAKKHVSSGYCQSRECKIVCESGWIDENGDMSDGCETAVTFTCGNDMVEAGESCDGKRLNDQSCETLVGAGSTGTVLCQADCMGFDTSNCTRATTCGNGDIDGAEKCDGRNLNGATCESVVGAGSTGFLACQDNCAGFDTESCSAPTTCGNSAIDSGEVCDGTQLAGASCASVVGTGSTGTLKCAANCADYDRSGCTAASECGNGILEAGEECDGSNFNGKTCEGEVGAGSRGTLSCNACKIVSTNCSAASTCGNGKIDGKDICDGSQLNGATCASIVGAGSTGILGCNSNCTGYDISGCTAASTCGNGIIEVGEVCDGAKLNDETCESQVGHGSTGRLRCNTTCTGYITDNCTASTTCGNGIIEVGEVCDGANTNGATCDAQVGAGSKGHVLCASDCKSLNLSGCSAATQCGNGKLDDGEVCEAGNLNKATCASIVGKGSDGTLKCGDGCKHFDTSGCSASEYCGDGKIEAGEICDGTNISGMTCEKVVGYGSRGTLTCKANCTGYDTTQCTQEVKCGNGKLDPGEKCDGTLLNNATCSSLVGYGSTGALKCNDTCSGYDTSACTEEVKCGNGVLDDGELCEGYNLNGATCTSIVGYGSTGTLKCNKTCSGFVTSGCSKAQLCGNGTLDSGELCDSTDLNDATCESVVGVGSTGTLLCDSTCKFNTTYCTPSRGCGNGTIEDNEECDGTAFKDNIKSCTAYDPMNYSKGSLKCTSTCKIDTSACESYCGNGSVNSSKGEVCDGDNLNKKTCASDTVVGPGSTGTLACAEDCKSFDISGCSESKYCGDGKINVDTEECDTTTFKTGSDDCAAYSSTYESGKLSCTTGCKVNTTACVKKKFCGDGIVNNDELCDDTKFKDNKTTCAKWNSDKYVDGNVSCKSDCTLNYDKCVEKPTVKCGNGKIDSGEQCDGSNLNGYSCATWHPDNYTGGTLSCTSNCTFDESKCEAKAKCGDGKIDPGEECDGSKFPNDVSACKSYDPDTYQKGTLKCTSSCKIDVSSCTAWCGNGEVNSTAANEICDTKKALTTSQTCDKIVGTGYTGTLKCGDDCKSWDTTGCIAPSCGDGKVNQATEECDGSKFKNGKTTCTGWNSAAYTSGNVSCNSDCTVNYSTCVAKEEKVCGDGVVNQSSEECDTNAFKNNIKTCAAYDSKYSSGDLKCTTGCKIDVSKCVQAPVTKCGNGQVDEDDDEWCDGDKFMDNVKTCAEFHSTLYASGNLKCTDTCEIDTSACKVHKCGDGVLSNSELCDGTKFNSLFDNCNKIDSRYSATKGKLKCSSDCIPDTSECVFACGDGTLDLGEYCDGEQFQSFMDSCDKWVEGSTGTLYCNKNCSIDYSHCTTETPAYCGDGKVNQPQEKCDGGAFASGNNTCILYSSLYSSGLLGCNSDCTINTDNCVKAPTVKCGNYKLDENEECDGSEFVYNIKTCKEYSGTYSNDETGKLKCTSECVIDDSDCLRNCTENEFRCVTLDNGRDKVIGCDSAQWIDIDTCDADEYCMISKDGDGNCVPKPTDPVDLQWCTFHWLTEASGQASAAYGRILLPNGLEPTLAYMACTTDINLPVANWEWSDEAVKNPSCSNCGSNTEYMMTTPYKGHFGLNYCTFIFNYGNKGVFACRPQQEGASAPILIDGTTKLTSDLTRKFTSTSCNEGEIRCSANLLQMCDENGEWIVMESCSSSMTCNAADGKCEEALASYDNLATMNSYTTKDITGYTTPKGETFSDGSTITVTGAFYTKDHVIDGVTAILRGGSYNTSVKITGLTAGIGTLSFKYAAWSTSEANVTLSITDGTTTKTHTVTKSNTSADTWSFTFNNKTATEVTIAPSAGTGRVLIDDVRFTSAL